MGITVNGISYAVGGLSASAVQRDLRVIRDDLNCDAVMLDGGVLSEQVSAAEHALELGLAVYLRPDLTDRRRPEVLRLLAAAATAAERLRARHPERVTLLLGNEYSLLTRGIIPGRWQWLRLHFLLRGRRLFARRINRRTNALLTAAQATARPLFGGPITYAAGFWEQVDWSGLDFVGVNLYRMGRDSQAYEEQVRALVRESAKPVVITEFGCGAFRGAEVRGPGAFLIVNWFAQPPRVREGYERDEATQAAYLGELIDCYAAAGVHGCFVFSFAMRDFPFSPDPRHDLDMAGFGVVKVVSDDPDQWEPKAAFRAVAARYRAQRDHC